MEVEQGAVYRGVAYGGVAYMAYNLDTMHEAKLAEREAFRRLYEVPDLEDWEEAFGAWLRAIRALQREKLLSRLL
jgi:hypothetical protein